MGRCRMVKPEQVRIELSDGDFIFVKKRLTAGEDIEMKTLAAGATGDGKVSLDLVKVPFAMVLTYLLGWSFVGLKDEPIPYSPDMDREARLKTLQTSIDAETLDEVTKAITDHVERVAEDLEKEKNDRATESESKVTSLSVA